MSKIEKRESWLRKANVRIWDPEFFNRPMVGLQRL